MVDFDLDQLPPRARQAFHQCVTGVFFEAADDNYINARILYAYGRTRGFNWCGAQAVEKYIKSALLMNGLSAKFSHSFSNSLESLKTVAGTLIPVDIDIPESSGVGTAMSWPKKVAFSEAIRSIEYKGKPEGRYRETYNTVEGYDLHVLDKVCFVLRRLSVALDKPKDTTMTWKDYLLANPSTTFELNRLRTAANRPSAKFNPHSHILAWNYTFNDAPPEPDGFLTMSLEQKAPLIPLKSLDPDGYEKVRSILTKNSKIQLPNQNEL